MKRMFMFMFAALACAVTLSGCASPPLAPLPKPPPGLFLDTAFGAPSLPIDARDVFALSPAMQHYLEVEIAPQLRSMGAQRGLIDALYRKAQLRLDYDTEVTRTAAEAFDARAGNCLSLVVMSAALAKHLALPVRYQALVGQEAWSRNGDLSCADLHRQRDDDRDERLDPVHRRRLLGGADRREGGGQGHASGERLGARAEGERRSGGDRD